MPKNIGSALALLLAAGLILAGLWLVPSDDKTDRPSSDRPSRPQKPRRPKPGDTHAGDPAEDERIDMTGRQDPARAPGMARFALPELPPEQRGNREIPTFNAAKDRLPKLFKGGETFYCQCRFSGKSVDLRSCGYKVRKNAERASRVEWEHVVPASLFGRTFAAWREGHPRCRKGREPFKGRKCAGEVSGRFNHMEADLYNLRPAIGEVNGDRSSAAFGEVSGEPREYGRCDFELERDVAEPREGVRGDIARAYLYMDWAYPERGFLDPQTRAQMIRWHLADPPDEAERAWAAEVARLQKNVNPFIQWPPPRGADPSPLLLGPHCLPTATRLPTTALTPMGRRWLEVGCPSCHHAATPELTSSKQATSKQPPLNRQSHVELHPL